jgi:nicotinamidase-related amidase
MLKRETAILIFIDVQGRLSELIAGAEMLFKNLKRLLAGMQALGIPVLATEQIPEKMGPTREEFMEFIPQAPVTKSTFSCCGEPAFVRALETSGRRQVILCGIETHVCVYQTALDLLAKGYEVYLATDAAGSRHPDNRALALRRMEAEGVRLTGTEMLLFELLGDAKDPAFKSILNSVK